MQLNWSRFVELVASAQRWLLTSHLRPDCDALGSELGMCLILEALGKQVQIVNPQRTPPNLQFIDPQRRIKALHEDVLPEALTECEVLLVLDTSAWAQLGGMADVLRGFRGRKLVLDHHVSEDDLGAEMFKDVHAEATGRLVVEAADQLGVPLTAEMARPLFAALATDTGWYRFSSTTGLTYRTAARLVEAGAVPAELYNALYEQDSLARLRLIGRALERARTELDGRLIHTAILREDFSATGALPSDTEDIINLTLAVAGTRVAMVLVEQAAGGCKLSLRSRCELDCSRVAEQFSGGGHKAAAGAMLPEPLEAARQRVLDALRREMG
ncbi:MAG: DHH family phosphoesterase [Pirellulales bacterium]|nr:DHH family phosphoesterase [Pirellulales bacterium]